MTVGSQLVPRLWAAACVCLGIWAPQVAYAQCAVGADAAVFIERLQQSHDSYVVSGTFLRESAGTRDFVSVSQSLDAPETVAQYFNTDADNAEQIFPMPVGQYLAPCEMAEHYAVTIALGPKVAGKATRILQLRPKDTLRLGYRLALDEESGVILRSDTISEKGELLERHEFASVTIKSTASARATTATPLEGPRYVKVPGLPSGYRASLARGFEERALFVSDGIAAATVIFEPLPSNVKSGEGAVRRGATLTYTRGSVVAGNNILVTVIGEVPLAAARVIADAVKLTPGQR